MIRRILKCVAVTAALGWGALAGAVEPIDSPLKTLSWQLQDNAPLGQDSETGNRIGVIDQGRNALLLRIHLIRSAEFSIDIQTFILENDESGRYVCYELLQAAKRGVKVRLLADHFMSARDPGWAASLATAHPNFELRYYRPPFGQLDPSKVELLFHGLLFFPQANQRMHNKTFIVDGAIAIIGGRNFDNHYFNQSLTYNFYDVDALVLGPVVPEMAESFESFWDYRRSIPARELGDVKGKMRQQAARPHATGDDFDFLGAFEDVDRDADDAALISSRFVAPLVEADRVQFVSDRPGKNLLIGFWGGGRATRTIRKLMRSADDELLIQSPYLILNWIARNQFRQLRRKNPDLDIIVSTNSLAATDNTLAYSANFKLRTAYIETIGMEIHEYMPRPAELLEHLPNHESLAARAAAENMPRSPYLCVHSKIFTVDGRTAYIGSYNFDPRSDNLNTEVGLIIDDPEIVEEVRACILGRTRPENAWVIAPREFPLSDVNFFLEALSGWIPVDFWPIRNATSFELIPGREAVPPGHPDFYKNYRDVGSFPGAEPGSVKELTTRVYKIFNTLAIPVL